MNMELETGRLVLRKLTTDDVDALFRVWGDAETMRFFPEALSREQVTALIERQLQRHERDGTGLWAVVLNETGEVIGDAGLLVQDVDGASELEIAYHLRRDCHGRGYATEAAKAWRDWAFSYLGKTRLISLVRPENLPSCRVAERVGMSIERETVRAGLKHLVYALNFPTLDVPTDC